MEKTWRRGAKYKSHIVGYGRTVQGTVATPKNSIRTSLETMRQKVVDLLDEQFPDWTEAMVEIVYFDKDYKPEHSDRKIIQKQ